MRKNLNQLLEMTSATYVCLHRLGYSPIEVLSSQSEKNIDKKFWPQMYKITSQNNNLNEASR